MRYGIYGGAFDPLHWGHLLLAESCLQQSKLDRLIFVPTGVSPHRCGKDNFAASAEHRLAMLRLAVADYAEYLISDYEVKRQKKSYTVETLRYFTETLDTETLNSEKPDKPELFLLTGADMFYDLPNWYCAEEICTLAVPLAVRRPNCPMPNYSLLKPLVSEERYRKIMQQNVMQDTIEMPLIGLSSSGIRKSVSEGKSIRFQVPDCVEKYIKENNLYRS
ncbi:putative nicotinate-nucleotide adenylyltransferase [Planctomycetales bacterium]|nr:putative nicotinate-nucleotide adenylyltransferase [Planctomycetales bacterium]